MTVTTITGDCRDVLPALPAESVQCCVTSPPYFGLRDYGAEGQIGLDRGFEAYVAELVAVFREVRRVLRDDGVLWLNLGDSYNGSGGTGGATEKQSTNTGSFHGGEVKRVAGLKPKDLIGVPWRIAFALQADGWWLRQDIIWSKPNPMPESVTDRCTKSHEYLFLLTKSARYYYDAKAIAEPGIEPAGTVAAVRGEKTRAYQQGREPSGNERVGQSWMYTGTRNKRSVWTVATTPYAHAHFATFPPKLIEPCILAGTSEKGHCVACGMPWVRVVERPEPPPVAPSGLDRYGTGDHGVHRKVGGQYQKWLDANPSKTVGWEPQCACNAPTSPDVVLDPFGGSGTTGEVAERLGRNSILIELNPAYRPLIEKRTAQQGMVLV